MGCGQSDANVPAPCEGSVHTQTNVATQTMPIWPQTSHAATQTTAPRHVAAVAESFQSICRGPVNDLFATGQHPDGEPISPTWHAVGVVDTNHKGRHIRSDVTTKSPTKSGWPKVKILSNGDPAPRSPSASRGSFTPDVDGIPQDSRTETVNRRRSPAVSFLPFVLIAKENDCDSHVTVPDLSPKEELSDSLTSDMI
jgi:hypothetical protein